VSSSVEGGIVAVAPQGERCARHAAWRLTATNASSGANRVATHVPSCLDDSRASGRVSALWSIFERDVELFRRQDRTDISARLLIAGSNVSRPALVTPPDHPMSASSNPNELQTCTRARAWTSIDISTLPAAPQAHGGLSPGAMRRVREIRGSAFWAKVIDLPMLAAAAGLSVHHFCATI